MRFYLLVLTFLILAGPSTAFAYLDPGTGSLILQVLVAGFAGAGVLIKLYWRKVCGWFGKKPESAYHEEKHCCAADHDSAEHK